MNHNNLTYLDNAFIVESYENIFNKGVPTKYSKTTDVSLGFNMIAKAGASLKETFEYPMNTREMYNEIKPQLNQIPEISLLDSDIKNLPNLFWMEGLFGIAPSRSSSDGNIWRYSFSAEVDKQKLFLATNDTYFSSGYDQLLGLLHVVDQYAIKAKMLLKSLGNTPNFSIASPMVVIKTGNFEHKKQG
jgi:hypothetical protein